MTNIKYSCIAVVFQRAGLPKRSGKNIPLNDIRSILWSSCWLYLPFPTCDSPFLLQNWNAVATVFSRSALNSPVTKPVPTSFWRDPLFMLMKYSKFCSYHIFLQIMHDSAYTLTYSLKARDHDFNTHNPSCGQIHNLRNTTERMSSKMALRTGRSCVRIHIDGVSQLEVNHESMAAWQRTMVQVALVPGAPFVLASNGPAFLNVATRYLIERPDRV